MDVPVPIVKKLRRVLRDFPDLNVLLGGQEETDDMVLAEHLADALADFIAAPPFMEAFQPNFWSFFDHNTGEPLENPKMTAILHQIVRRAAITVLQSVGTQMQRNELQYQSGNSTVAINDKWKGFQTTIGQYQSEYEDRRNGIKYQMNLEQVYTAIHSNISNVLRGSIPFLSAF